MVEHFLPSTLKEALEIRHNHDVTVIAGGTDLMVQHRSWSELPPNFNKPLLFIFNLKELKYVETHENAIHIGSMTDLEALLEHEEIPSALKEIIALMASPAIRYMCTLAGNIGNASPAGDSLLALYALDAKLVLKRHKGERIVPIDEFIKGPRQTIIENDEIIKEIQIDKDTFTHQTFKKIGGRKSDAISKLAFLGLAQVNETGVVKSIRLVFNAVAPTLTRLKDLEKELCGQTVQDIKKQKEAILESYDRAINPIDDQRSNRVYRRQAALNLIKQFIDAL